MGNWLLLLGDMATRAAAKTSTDYHGITTVRPAGLAILVGLAVWMFLAPRRSALVPFLVLICFIPSAQRIVIAGADFTLLRLMAIGGIGRVLCRNEISRVRFNRIDGVYVAWVLVGSLAYVFQRGEASALVYVAGRSLDKLGAYFVARVFVQTIEDFRAFARSVAIIAIPVGIIFAIELATQRNLFAFFGGVPEITAVREDRLRCQGAFAHPILAGVFWAAAGALTLGGAFARQARPIDRRVFAAGTLASVFAIAASASSTPLLGFVAGIGFWMCWPVRRLMRYPFMAAPFVLAALHLVMEGPVWSLVARVSAVGGSTGFHRYVLIDGAINHFHEWWLVGTRSTIHWHQHFQTFDITNQFILEGVRGGIGRLGLFLLLIFLVAKAIRRAQRRTKNRSDELLLYGLAASLFTHCVCFIGVSYFGQIQYLWYFTLAIGGSATSSYFFHPGTAGAISSSTRPNPARSRYFGELSFFFRN